MKHFSAAGLAYGVLLGWTTAAAVLLPTLVEALRDHPHLAMLGMLGLWLAPIPVVAVGHHGGHKALDRFDVEKVARGLLPGVESWWSGLFTWFVILFATTVTSLVAMVLTPPRLPDPDALSLARAVRPLSEISPASALWLALAAGLYAIEARVRKKGA